MDENAINLDDIVDYEKEYSSRLQKVTINRRNNTLTACCPFHEDKDPSLSVNLKTGQYKCFGCNAEGNYTTFYNEFYKLQDTKEAYKRILAEHGKLTERKPLKYTVADYAKEKRFNIEWLTHDLGISDAQCGTGYIRIPYFDEQGKQASVRYRYHKDSKQRFAWAKSSKPLLYGEWKFDKIRAKGYAILCEGESDAQTLWTLHFPALGVPGATTFKAEWAAKLAGIPKLYIHVEPDTGGQTFRAKTAQKLREGGYTGEIYEFSCSDYDKKDPSALYLEYGEEDAAAKIDELLKNAKAIDVEQIKDVPALAQKTSTITLSELVKKNLPPVNYVVDNLLPQGLSILASPPKFGKSWFVLDLCSSVAEGKPFLGYKTSQCRTLYYALEDSLNRLKERTLKVLEGNVASELCEISITAPTLDNGFVKELETQIANKPDIKLIVIDTLQKIRGKASKTDTAYGHDYAEIGALKAFADKHGIAVLLVHHLRKMSDDGDVFNRISGTNGIAGAADTMLVLSRKKRTDDETILTITGRDVEQNEFLVTFDKTAYKWRIIGDTEEETERREYEAYRNDPIVRTIKKLLDPSGSWSGTATELFNACLDHTGKFQDELMTSRKLSSYVRKLQKQLFERDKITYTPPNPNGGKGGRIHTFKDISRNNLCNI